MFTEPCNPSEHWEVAPEIRASFRGGLFRYRKVRGAASFVRIIGNNDSLSPEGMQKTRGNPRGLFWISLNHFLALRRTAFNNVATQTSPGGYKQSVSALAGVQIRDSIRNELAVSRDWNFNDFSCYVSMMLANGSVLYLLEGVTAPQPVYSKTAPAEMQVTANTMMLPGGATQYVIDLRNPRNFGAKVYLSGPIPF